MKEDAKPNSSLTAVLDQNEQVKDLVDDAFQKLSSVNATLGKELADQDASPAVENALLESKAVESTVQEATDKLSHVNRALEGEVRDRAMLEHRYAAVTLQEKVARHSAFHDTLTGLPNRALLNDRLTHGLAQAKRHDWTLAVMFIDLDGFKAVNDTHGHDAGDSVLQTIAARLKSTTRGDDTVSRHGGDEFLYVLTEIRDERNIAMIAQKIIQVIEAPCCVPGLDVGQSARASIGISVFPKDGTTAEALITSADKAMYRAKQGNTGFAFALQATGH